MDKLLQIKDLSKEQIKLIEDLICNSYEAQHLGIERTDSFIEEVANGLCVPDEVAIDNILKYGEYDKIYIEEVSEGLRAKDGLSEDEKKLASDQLHACAKELTFLSIVNYKIRALSSLLELGSLS